MDKQNTLQKLIETYQAKGYSDEEITKLTQDLILEAIRRFSKIMMVQLTPDDIKAVEAIQDKKQAEEEAMRLYRQKSEKNPDDEVQAILSTLVEKSLKEHTTVSPQG